MCCLANAQKANVIPWIIIDSVIASGLLIGKVHGWRETRWNSKVYWAKEASKTACHELTLCILGLFSRDQSRIKGDDIVSRRANLSYLFSEPLLERNSSACPPGAASCTLSSPIWFADVTFCRDIVTASCISPSPFWRACSFHLVEEAPKT